MKLVVSSIGFLALVIFTSIVIYEFTKTEVVLKDNGENKTVNTHKDTVGELLKEVGISVGKNDQLSHDLSTEIENGMIIDYDTANQITLVVDGQSNTYYSTADTVGGFFEEENLSFSEHDDISLKNTDKIEHDLQIDVTKAFDVAINDGGEEQVIKTTGGTIQSLLKQNGITIDEDDRVKPALEEKVTKDTSIEIVRVEVQEEVIEEKVTFETETKEDNSLLKGTEKVIREGKEGKVVNTYEITLENGEEVERKLLDTEVKEEPVKRIVAVGTKKPKASVATLSTSTDSSNHSGGKTLNMKASAFTASCSGCSGYTATGINLKSNPSKKVIAVDPNVIPLGTRVWVEGYGEAIAGDTGGHIKGSRIDIHVPNKSQAYQWGVRNVQVKILD